MQPSILQQPRVAIIIHVVMGVILVVAAYVAFSQLPNGDLGAVFNPDVILQALNTGQTNLLILTLAAFGVGLGANYLLTVVGKSLNMPILGKIVVALIALIVIGGLVVGVLVNWLTGISVPFVMNPGMGLLVGSGIGWWISNALSRQSA